MPQKFTLKQIKEAFAEYMRNFPQLEAQCKSSVADTHIANDRMIFSLVRGNTMRYPYYLVLAGLMLVFMTGCSETRRGRGGGRVIESQPRVVQITEHMSDADLEKYIGNHPDLRMLVLENSAVTDAGLSQVTQLKQLKILSLRRTPLTGGGLPHLAGMELEKLSLQETAGFQ